MLLFIIIFHFLWARDGVMMSWWTGSSNLVSLIGSQPHVPWHHSLSQVQMRYLLLSYTKSVITTWFFMSCWVIPEGLSSSQANGWRVSSVSCCVISPLWLLASSKPGKMEKELARQESFFLKCYGLNMDLSERILEWSLNFSLRYWKDRNFSIVFKSRSKAFEW